MDQGMTLPNMKLNYNYCLLQICRKAYDYNVLSRNIGLQEEPSEEAEDEAELRSSGEAEEDIVPLYLHIPRSAGCPKFCISLKVEITRAGRQIKQHCRKSFICKTKR